MPDPDITPGPHLARRLPARALALAAAGMVACMIASHSAAGMETGDLDTLRQTILGLVNKDRREQNLPPLKLDATVNEAAQNHAEDMFRRDYYSHRSPEGNTVMDRYLEAGGSSALAVAENIARCEGCPLPPDRETVERLQRGWMNSPEHRDNILATGMESFGFGIAGETGRGLYAVQNFTGPGTPRTESGTEARTLEPEALQALALDLVNRARRQQGVEPLSDAPALVEAGQAALAGEGDGGRPSARAPFRHLPPDARERWRNFQSLAGECGGCGTEPTDADIGFFVGQWLDQVQYRDVLLDPGYTHGGLAMSADGSGGKTALMVLAGE